MQPSPYALLGDTIERNVSDYYSRQRADKLRAEERAFLSQEQVDKISEEERLLRFRAEQQELEQLSNAGLLSRSDFDHPAKVAQARQLYAEMQMAQNPLLPYADNPEALSTPAGRAAAVGKYATATKSALARKVTEDQFKLDEQKNASARATALADQQDAINSAISKIDAQINGLNSQIREPTQQDIKARAIELAKGNSPKTVPSEADIQTNLPIAQSELNKKYEEEIGIANLMAKQLEQRQAPLRSQLQAVTTQLDYLTRRGVYPGVSQRGTSSAPAALMPDSSVPAPSAATAQPNAKGFLDSLAKSQPSTPGQAQTPDVFTNPEAAKSNLDTQAQSQQTDLLKNRAQFQVADLTSKLNALKDLNNPVGDRIASVFMPDSFQAPSPYGLSLSPGHSTQDKIAGRKKAIDTILPQYHAAVQALQLSRPPPVSPAMATPPALNALQPPPQAPATIQPIKIPQTVSQPTAFVAPQMPNPMPSLPPLRPLQPAPSPFSNYYDDTETGG